MEVFFIVFLLIRILVWGGVLFVIWKLLKWLLRQQKKHEETQHLAERKNKPFTYEVDVWLYFVNGIACYFIILLSLGIAGPWAICKWGRFHASKSSINGKNLEFTGNAIEFLPTYLILILLMIVTAGIYGIWAGPKVMKWYWESFDFKE